MRSVGNSYNNALCESFFASLECKLIDRVSATSLPRGRQKVLDYIERLYNAHSRLSSLD